MISKVTESNKQLIEKRLGEISTALGRTISNLEEYYANIIDISKLTTDFHNAPYKYFLMPLDEPIFEIDANKRTIAVPTHFAKNGIGVYGDHMAEVLYFRIDRYFDYQDLFSVDEIVINWQFRPANVSRNTEIKTMTSIALAPDDTFDPGHIVFGWVITNDMTPSKGTLTFSVSFIKRNGEDYKYVLNTTTASVAINDSLLLEDPKKLDELKRPIFDRLSNSKYTPENMVPLVDPVFRTGERINSDDSVEFVGLPSFANFTMDAEGKEDSELLLQVIGYASDDGVIRYAWSGTKFNGDTVPDDPNDFTVAADYVLTKDTEKQDNIKYYTNVDGVMTLLADDEVNAALEDLTVDVYELGSSFVVTDAGAYLVRMQSEKSVQMKDENDVITESSIISNEISSEVCVVPMAAVPKVELLVKGQVSFDAKEEFKNGNLIKLDTESDYTYIDEEKFPEIQATISIDKDKVWNEEEKTGIKGVTSDSSIGAIALVLTNEPGDDGKPTSFKDLTFEVPKDGMLKVAKDAEVEGQYKVYAVNRRNHTYNVSDTPSDDEIINVSKVAPKITQMKVVAIKAGNTETDDTTLIEGNKKLEENKLGQVDLFGGITQRTFVLSVGDTLSSEVELELKVVEVDDTEAHLPLDSGAENNDNEYIPSKNETSGKYEFTISEGGCFVVKAVTTYHGTQCTSISDPFRIVTL